MRQAVFRLAAAIYRGRVRRAAAVLPDGSEDEAVTLFDALQRQAYDEGGWQSLLRYWTAEATALLQLRISRRASSRHLRSGLGGAVITWWQRDLTDAWRALRRSPGYTAVTLAMLALGIGVNVAVFSVVDALLFKALPYAAADRLVLAAEWPRTGGNWTVAPTMFEHWRTSTASVTAMEARLPRTVALLDGGDPEEVRGARVTSGYFDLLGINASLGRTFQPADAGSERPCVAVISHRLFSRRFGADPARVGGPVRLTGQVCTLIGVLPPDSVFDRGAPELYVPLVFTPAEARSEGRQLTVLARLRDGVSVEQASGELAASAAAFNRTRGSAGKDWTATAFAWRDILVRTDARQLVWILFGAVVAVLAIACANVAGLSLSRAIGRRREIAVRAALGAGRARVFRALITESVLLSALGGVVAIGVGALTLRALIALVPPGTFPAEVSPALDGRALAFALLAALATGVVAGLLPAWQAGQVALTEALVATGRGFTASRSSTWAQGTLLVVELALAMVLVSGASLLAVSFAKLVAVQPGFDTANVLTVRLSAPSTRYKTDNEVASLFARARAAIQRVAGVEAVGGATSLPLGGWLFGTPFMIEGAAAPSPVPSAHLQSTTPGYFDALRISLAEGRPFADTDDARGQPVVIVNETLARRFMPPGPIVGRRLRLSAAPSSADPSWEIVGVIRNVKTGGLAEADQATPEIYVPESQLPMPTMLFAVRSSHDDPMRLVPEVRAAVRSIDPELPVGGVMAMDERLGASVRSQRFRTTVIGTFAFIAALLACLGAYAVRSRAVAARVREMGIRMALGATREQLVRLSLGQGVRLAGVGLGLGTIGAVALTRYLRPWLFDTSSADPTIIVTAIVVLGAAAATASWLPARRAGSVDPLTVLRNE